MILADVNVMLHAFRDDSADHRRCREWLENAVNGESAYAISTQVLSSVVRLATHPRIFVRPSTPAQVLDYCAAVMTPTHCHLVHPGPRHWDIFARLCHETNAKGNIVTDAWLAALAIEWGCEFFTLDGDFARFRGLRLYRP